jgi:hypothetical protein
VEANNNGLALQALVSIWLAEPQMGPIMKWMSQEQIELMVHANLHGKKFITSGGSHVCSDDFSKAQVLLAREKEIAE